MDYEVKMAHTNQRTVKIKASHAQIVVGGSKENPVYSILYFDTDKGQWYIGWSSSHLVYVQNWLQEEFEPGYKRISDFITALLTRAKAAEAENAQLRAKVERWKSAHHQAALNFQQENRECNKALSELEQMKSENTALRKMQPVRLDDTGAQALALAAEVSELKQKLAAAEARAEKAEEIASDLCYDFTDFVTGGIHNAAPYCANCRPECINAHGWCNGDNKVCRGFMPKAAVWKEE